MANSQTFPSAPDPEKKLTRLQERLMKKLGEHAHPFTFEVASQRPGFTGPLNPTWYRSRTWIVAHKDSGGFVVEPFCSSVLILSVPAPCLLRFL